MSHGFMRYQVFHQHPIPGAVIHTQAGSLLQDLGDDMHKPIKALLPQGEVVPVNLHSGPCACHTHS
eukprot:3009038-Heterocapsa_arctica.AAC.1